EGVEQEPLLDREAVVGEDVGDGAAEGVLVERPEVGGVEVEGAGEVGQRRPLRRGEAAGGGVVEVGGVEREALLPEGAPEVHAVPPPDPHEVLRPERVRPPRRRDQVVQLDVRLAPLPGRDERVEGGLVPVGQQVERLHFLVCSRRKTVDGGRRSYAYVPPSTVSPSTGLPPSAPRRRACARGGRGAASAAAAPAASPRSARPPG